ncbi:MAG TPA: hypothetical protein VHF26_14010, partial [Trebonia sp.]|nr:hypothetical protein [Trebonia sp.]
MADGGTVPFQAGQEPPAPPYRPRGAYAGHELFGQGTGAVLVEPEVARDLRLAAEFATQEGRIAGGLLYGRTWADDEGAYLVVDGFLEAGPGENRGDQISRAGTDDFTLSAADLELLRQDAARMYTAAVEVGWWRSRPGPGEFGTRDLLTQRELVGPDGVGLLVFGSGPEWGAAYAGPNGRVPGPGAPLAPALPGADPGLAPTAGPAADPDSGPAPETGT